MSEEATLAQLRQSLGLLQVAFDAAAEAMVIVEPGGEVRWGNQAAADLVTQNYVAGKLAQIDTDTLPERAIGEIEKEEEARTEQIEDIDVEQWLREGSVGAIPKIPSEAAEWRRENRSDPNVKTAGGGQGSLYDEDTGFLIFKSPNLPPNHVEPRPGGDSANVKAGFGSKTTQNWDLLYSKTHNADGTPKTEE